MLLAPVDWTIVAVSIVLTIAIGVWSGRRAGKSADEYFLTGRSMGWGLLGVSIVATTFSTDTPNLVTGLTRQHGVAGNWSWWAFLLTTLSTAFFFGGLWRRSGVATDNEFYELRYSGRAAAILRGFRSIYLGVVINVVIMGAVTLALIKFSSVLLGLSPLLTVAIAGAAAIAFTAAGGLRGVVISDFFLFLTAMSGAVAAAYFAVNHPAVGGIEALFSNERVRAQSSFIPDMSDPSAVTTLLLAPLVIQWWSVWYPGAEPGGGGFAAQRMFAAKDERNAVAAITLFAFAHYVVRPWPWILVALSSLVVFPDIDSLRAAFPTTEPGIISDDFAYPAMLTFIPPVWLGIVAASLIGAYLSTIGTTLNLGASYIVYDVYARFMKPAASEKEKVRVGRIATVVLMLMTGVAALTLKSADQAFRILLSIGAGTGLLYMLRWYWPRINAWSEISAMVFAFVISIGSQSLPVYQSLPAWAQMTTAVAATTAGWIAVTLLTPRTDEEKLRQFYMKVRPPGPGWRRFAPLAQRSSQASAERSGVGASFLCMFSGTAFIYGALFLIGEWLQGRRESTAATIVGLVAAGIIFALGWRGLRFAPDVPLRAKDTEKRTSIR